MSSRMPRSGAQRLMTKARQAIVLTGLAVAARAGPGAPPAQEFRGWASVGLGAAALSLGAVPGDGAKTHNGATVDLEGGIVLDSRWRLGVAASTVVIRTTWCGSLCTPDEYYQNQEWDRYYAVARYCVTAGCGGWFLHAGTGFARYLDAHADAPPAYERTVALERQGNGWGYEIGAGYRFRPWGASGRAAFSLLATYGGARMRPDAAGAGNYRSQVAAVYVAVAIH